MVSNPSPTLKLSEGREEGHDKTVERNLKKRHGREYSLQLKVTDKPVNHVVVVQVEEQIIADAGDEEEVAIDGIEADKTEADFEVAPKKLSRIRPPPPQLKSVPSPPHKYDPNLLSPLDARQIARQHHHQQRQHHPRSHSNKPPSAHSSEREFARQFGYSPPTSPTSPITFFNPFDDSSPPTTPIIKRRSWIKKGRTVTVDEDEEGTLVLLPPPPLLRPYSFWRNTSRSALHTPSFHLIRRSTFIAAGLSLEKPFCDLSISAVEGRITIGKLKGLSGGAAISNSWDLFAC